MSRRITLIAASLCLIGGMVLASFFEPHVVSVAANIIGITALISSYLLLRR